MNPPLPIVSGAKTVTVLESRFGFKWIHQRGSHVKLRKIVGGRKLTVIVPLHNELADGTLLSILKMACISMDDFLEAL